MRRLSPAVVGSGAGKHESEARAQELGWAGLRERARREMAAQEEKELAFLFIFQLHSPQTPIFELQKFIFRRCPKNKSCPEFHSLQHCFKVHFEIPIKF
jgi:hypothetical protein